MPASFDEGRLHELIVESEDLQSDAMKGAKRDLDDYVAATLESRYERRNDERPRPQGRSTAMTAGGVLLGAGALTAAGMAFAGSAFAADSDVAALQTAAGLENLAVFTYKTALTLPYIGGSSANGVVKAFAKMTMSQHQEHADAFNAAAVKAGGKKQTGTDPKYTPIVQSEAGKLNGPADVVALAITLEDVAAQTYVKDTQAASSKELRGLFASVAGVESQHKAVLLAVQALLKGNLASEIKLPPDAAKLPKAAGSVGFPDGFYSTSMAVAASEGAVK